MRDMNEKTYVISLMGVLACLIGVTFYCSYYLRSLDLPYQGTDVLRQYQVAKLQNTNDIELIVVGDSSGGNGIDAAHLSELSGLTSANLTLNGSFGLIGSYNMIRHALETQPDLEVVVIINTPDTWSREFNEEAYLSTLYELPHIDFYSVFLGKYHQDSFKHLFNPKEIVWYIQYQLYGTLKLKDIENDYIKQADEKYSNGGRTYEDGASIISSEVNWKHLRIFELTGELCDSHKLTCIFINGPMHERFYDENSEAIHTILAKIKNTDGITVIDTIFTYPEEKMGDSEDHVDPQYKNENTKVYFESIEDLIK